MTDSEQPIQTIEELTKRFQHLDQERSKAKTEHTRAETTLALAKETAKKLYQTDDVAELEELLEKWKRENTEKRAAYQKDLDAIEAKLQQVQAEFESKE